MDSKPQTKETESSKDEKQGNGVAGHAGEAKLPGIVIACAMAQFLAAFSFTCMTSMTGLVWMILFNFGPTELGMFLTGVGVLSIFINVFGVKTAIKHIGAPRTIAIACILQTIGIAGYTFITLLDPRYFRCTINVGFSFSLPTLLQIATPAVHQVCEERQRHIACNECRIFDMPFISGSPFQSDILCLKHDYGSFSHIMWLINWVDRLC